MPHDPRKSLEDRRRAGETAKIAMVKRPPEIAMTWTTTAVYENGLLRLTTPLPLAEGETVEMTLTPVKTVRSRPAEDEIVGQVKEAKVLAELFAIANAAPEDDDGYDLLRALEANRKFSGDYRSLLPPEHEGASS